MIDIINGKYAITENGQVYSYYSKRFLKQEIAKNGYARVYLDGKHYLTHRLVAEAYIPNPENLPCVNHKNHDRADNRASNLEWCSYQYNNKYSNCIEAMAASHKKPVKQLTLGGELIKVWDSAADADKGLGITGVYRGANGTRKTVGGFRWEYVNEEGN